MQMMIQHVNSKSVYHEEIIAPRHKNGTGRF